MVTLNAVVQTQMMLNAKVRPNWTVVLENIENLHKLASAGRKLKLHEIAEELKISEGNVFIILHEYFSMRKQSSKFADSQSKTITRR